MKTVVVATDGRVLHNVAFLLQMRYPDVEVVAVTTASKVLATIENEAPDVVIVDSSFTGPDTIILIKELRKTSDALLVILTETESDIDKAQLLEVGADEYVGKPLSAIKLLSKVKALLRRVKGLGFQEERTLSMANGLTIHFSTREVDISGKRVQLTPHEYDLLSELARNVGKVVTHAALLDRVWGEEYSGDSEFLKKYIYRLRTKLETNPAQPRLLVNERGIGYKLILLIAFLVFNADSVFCNVPLNTAAEAPFGCPF